MKIAVLGAGSAGLMAVAQVEHYLPDAELVHFHDPSRPSIGVGEGTTPAFVDWAEQVCGWDLDRLRDTCDATRKAGIVFEGWGAGHSSTHFFGSAEGAACHLSAAKLGAALTQRSSARIVAERVVAVVPDGAHATITTGDGAERFDFVFDARGFPDRLDAEHVRLDAVSTDAALLVRGPTSAPHDRTRAIARPHGWVFVIPLRDATAYGYVHSHAEHTSAAADFDRVLREEAVEPTTAIRSLRFPNYRRRELADGVVFAIGNRAAFVEPLEASSLGLIVLELQAATAAMLTGALGGDLVAATTAAAAQVTETIDEMATFIGWHYGAGSDHDTPFWQRARAAFDTWFADRPAPHRDRFATFQRRGAELSPALARADSVGAVDRLLAPIDAALDTFGGFPDASFAKIGHGIGWREPVGCVQPRGRS